MFGADRPVPGVRLHRTSIRRIQKPNRRGSAQEASTALSSLDFEKGGVSQRSFRCASHPAVVGDVRPSRRELLALHSYWASLRLQSGLAPTRFDVRRWCGSTWRRVGQIGHCRTSSRRMGFRRENRAYQACSTTPQGRRHKFSACDRPAMPQTKPPSLHCPQVLSALKIRRGGVDLQDHARGRLHPLPALSSQQLPAPSCAAEPCAAEPCEALEPWLPEASTPAWL